jgi:putative inorganic carbon (HCO3(-)) transporter
MFSVLHGSGPLIMYIGGVIAFLLSIVWKPQVGLYYLVPLLPMQTARDWLHGPGLPLGEKLVDVLLLGVLIGLLLHRAERQIFVSSPLNRVLLVIFVLTYLSLWQGAFYLGGPMPISFDDPRFSTWKNYVEMFFLFFIAAASIRTRKQMAIVIGLMCVSVLIVNRNYLGTVGDRNFSHFSYDLRDAGALGWAGENGMGAFQAEIAVFLIGLALFAKKMLPKLGLLAIALFSIYCLELTLSRGAYAGFLMGLLVLGLIKERRILILLAIIVVTWQSLVPYAVTQRVMMTYQEGEGLDSSAGERVTIWQDALKVFNEEPILGTGFNTYAYMRRVMEFTDTHNYYLKILLETGLTGLLIFLWLLAVACKMSWRLFRVAQDPLLSALGCGLFAMLICVLVVNFFGDRWTYLQVNGFLWVLLGLVARGLYVVSHEKESQKEAVPAMESEEFQVDPSAAHEVSHS